MDGTLTADDVFEIAERIEHNGGQFYIRAAEIAGFGSLATTLRELAEMEAHHEAEFASMRERLADRQDALLPLDANTEIARYLNGLVHGRFFAPGANPLEHLTGSELPRDILMTAVGLEKETITFYLGVKEVVRNQADKEIVDRIIRQEMGHVADLTHHLANLPV